MKHTHTCIHIFTYTCSPSGSEGYTLSTLFWQWLYEIFWDINDKKICLAIYLLNYICL